MASRQQLDWLVSTFKAALSASYDGIKHPHPDAAACEAAEETEWGRAVPKNSNNVLGIKVFKGWTGQSVDNYGEEQVKDGEWTQKQLDHWCVFDSVEECFNYQIKILQEPRYAVALAAKTVEEYIMLESKVWSTSQEKGAQVLSIWKAHNSLLVATP